MYVVLYYRQRFWCVDWWLLLSRGEGGTTSLCARDGFHSVSNYHWFKGEKSMEDECHPILYAVECGAYKCRVNVKDGETADFCFTIQGKMCGVMSEKPP